MDETLFYSVWIIRTIYILSLRIVLFTVLFLFFKENVNIAHVSILGILINLSLILSAFFITRVMDKVEIKTILLFTIGIQLIFFAAIYYLIGNVQTNLVMIMMAATVLFMMSAIENSLFDKSIVLLLPSDKRSRGVSLGLVTTSLSYILSPTIASLLLPLIASQIIVATTGVSLLIYLVVLTKLRKKYSISLPSEEVDSIFKPKEFQKTPVLLQLLLAFSLATIWMNFISFLIIPIMKQTHHQLFVGLVLSLSGIGSLLGGLSVGAVFKKNSNKKSLIYCFLYTNISMVLFIGFSASTYLCILLAILGGIFSSWSYGVAQIISQDTLNQHKIAGFYMFRNACSALVLIVFYTINLFFSRNIENLMYSIIIYLILFAALYLMFYLYGKKI